MSEPAGATSSSIVTRHSLLRILRVFVLPQLVRKHFFRKQEDEAIGHPSHLGKTHKITSCLSEANMATVERKEAPGALSHLFEAATALAGMNEFQVPAQTMDNSSRASVISDEDASSKRVLPVKTSPSSASKREIFPQRLLAILDDPSLSDIVTWLPHGRSFVIIRPDVFTEKVLPKYLPPVDSRGSTKYPSFTRKLNRW